MCLILFAWKTNSEYPLVLLANRDEFYGRPTSPAGWWEDDPQVWAGRDLEAGGTWMGMNKLGRFAAITNYREPHNILKNAPSRGALVADYLQKGESPQAYLAKLRETGTQYNGFNLIFGNRIELLYYSNRGAESAGLVPGIYGLSNHLLDSPWPKVRKGKEGLKALLEEKAEGFPRDKAFALLKDDTQAPDEDLPDTGVGLEWERRLSPLFIKGSKYGTRASTLMLMGKDQSLIAEERSGIPEQINRIQIR